MECHNRLGAERTQHIEEYEPAANEEDSFALGIDLLNTESCYETKELKLCS